MVRAMQDDTSCANITIIDDASFESDHIFSVHVTSIELESGGTDPLLDIGMSAYATINIEDNECESTLLQCYCVKLQSGQRMNLSVLAHTHCEVYVHTFPCDNILGEEGSPPPPLRNIRYIFEYSE